MSSEAVRSWSLTPRRRRVVIIATCGSGAIAFVVAALTLGWSEWWDVVGITSSASGIALLLTTVDAPMIEDRADWKNPVPRMDRRTKRRALRCIRRGETVGAPAGVDLEVVSFYWGWRQMKSLRSALGLALLLLGDQLGNGWWMRLIGIAFGIWTVLFLAYAVRDIRSCRRFLDASARTESADR
jgi:amino acid transporter